MGGGDGDGDGGFMWAIWRSASSAVDLEMMDMVVVAGNLDGPDDDDDDAEA